MAIVVDTWFSRTRVEIYNPLGDLRTFFQYGFGPLISINFSFDETGARDFSLLFAEGVNIERNDTIKIHIPNEDNPNHYLFFTGVVRDIPILGSTDIEFRYSGYGFNDFLTRINTESKSYSSTDVRTIVIDLLDDIIVSKTPITKDLTKISADLSGISLSSLTASYLQIPDVLAQLRDIANSTGDDYITGVDYEGDFFFKKRDVDVKYNLYANGVSFIDSSFTDSKEFFIPDYNPKDTFEAVTKLYVKKNDGTYYKTFTSAADNPINELMVVAPEIDESDIDNWAEGILRESESISREAQIQWYGPQLLTADGTLRITSFTPATSKSSATGTYYGQGLYGRGLYGGGFNDSVFLSDVLKIKEVVYMITDGTISKEISLGALPIELDREILKVREKVIKLQNDLI